MFKVVILLVDENDVELDSREIAYSVREVAEVALDTAYEAIEVE